MLDKVLSNEFLSWVGGIIAVLAFLYSIILYFPSKLKNVLEQLNSDLSLGEFAGTVKIVKNKPKFPEGNVLGGVFIRPTGNKYNTTKADFFYGETESYNGDKLEVHYIHPNPCVITLNTFKSIANRILNRDKIIGKLYVLNDAKGYDSYKLKDNVVAEYDYSFDQRFEVFKCTLFKFYRTDILLPNYFKLEREGDYTTRYNGAMYNVFRPHQVIYKP